VRRTARGPRAVLGSQRVGLERRGEPVGASFCVVGRSGRCGGWDCIPSSLQFLLYLPRCPYFYKRVREAAARGDASSTRKQLATTIMMTVLLRGFVALTLSTPCFCQAELLFYKGLMKMDRLGDGGESKQSYRVWVVVDRETGHMAKLDYFSAVGFRLYTVEEYQGFQTVGVAAGGGRTNSVITKAETSLNSSNQLTVSSIFVQGANARLGVKPGSTVWFPRTLDWTSRGVAPSAHTVLSETWTETGVVTFDGIETAASNTRAETLAQAEARLIAEFQGKGYREFLVR
jgi:hypothetical protein